MGIKAILNSPMIRKAYRWSRHNRVRKVLGMLFFYAIILFLMYSNFQENQVSLEVDEVAKQTIIADKTATVVDQYATEELKDEAASKVEKVYKEDKDAERLARQNFGGIQNDINAILLDPVKSQQQQLDALESYLSALVHKKDIGYGASLKEMSAYLVYASEEETAALFAAGGGILDESMGKAVTEQTIGKVYVEISDKVDNLTYDKAGLEFIKLVCKHALRPTMVYDESATQTARDKARRDIMPVEKTVKAGEVIVRQGNRVTEEQIAVLEQLGIQRNQGDNLALLGVSLFVAISFALVIVYLRRYNRPVYEKNNQLFMLGMIVIIILLITKMLLFIELNTRPEFNTMMAYLAPVAAASMLVGILLEQRLAYFITVILAFFTGLLSAGNQLDAGIVAFVGGVAGIYIASSMNQTSDLAKAAVGIILADTATILTLSLLRGNFNLDVATAAAIIGLINGLLSAVLMFGSLPLLEAAFGMTSTIKLMELANPNNELLKRLLIEAPGTYHHSLMVGNLAEATAEVIGANPLLVRAGAYYHDIGKILRPEYFVENQRGAVNPHDRIAPALSALIITSHTREGAELAQEYRLPESIIDFISQHHGTGVTYYFYNKAVQEEGADYVNMDNYRYEGPRPRSKELALVMLADAVEAAVRSMPDTSLEKIKEKVQRIVAIHLNDRQFEECDLTFKDLHNIEKNFLTVLEGIYHKRIEYPENLARELSLRREQYGYDDFKPSE